MAVAVAERLAADPGQGPQYRRLAVALSALIAAGLLPEGAGLPSERDLARSTGLSRVTVRGALRHLVDEGRLVRRQGSGTYVARPRPEPMSVQPLISLSEDLRRRGMVPRSHWIARSLHPPLGDETMALGLPTGELVARLERVRLADDRPLAIERSSLPASILPDPEAVAESLYDLLATRGLRPERAVQRIGAVNATPRDAGALGVLPGAALLKVERVTYLSGGRAAEFTRAFYRGDAYDLVSELR